MTRRPPLTSAAAGQPGADRASRGPHVVGLEVPGEGRGGPGWSGLARLHFAVPTLASSELLVRPPSKDVWGGCCGPGAQPAWAGPAGEITPSLGWLVVSLSCAHLPVQGKEAVGQGPSIILDHQRAWAERSLTFLVLTCPLTSLLRCSGASAAPASLRFQALSLEPPT